MIDLRIYNNSIKNATIVIQSDLEVQSPDHLILREPASVGGHVHEPNEHDYFVTLELTAVKKSMADVIDPNDSDLDRPDIITTHYEYVIKFTLDLYQNAVPEGFEECTIPAALGFADDGRPKAWELGRGEFSVSELQKIEDIIAKLEVPRWREISNISWRKFIETGESTSWTNITMFSDSFEPIINDVPSLTMTAYDFNELINREELSREHQGYLRFSSIDFADEFSEYVRGKFWINRQLETICFTGNSDTTAIKLKPRNLRHTFERIADYLLQGTKFSPSEGFYVYAQIAFEQTEQSYHVLIEDWEDVNNPNINMRNNFRLTKKLVKELQDFLMEDGIEIQLHVPLIVTNLTDIAELEYNLAEFAEKGKNLTKFPHPLISIEGGEISSKATVLIT